MTVTELLQARISLGISRCPWAKWKAGDGVSGPCRRGKAKRSGRQAGGFSFICFARRSPRRKFPCCFFSVLREYLVLEIFWNLEGLSLFFGGWFWLTRYTRLPAYYDQNAIGFVSAGICVCRPCRRALQQSKLAFYFACRTHLGRGYTAFLSTGIRGNL